MKILICANEDILMTALEFRLRKAGFQAVRAADTTDALHKIRTHVPDMLITDVFAEDDSGIALVKDVREGLNSSIPIILIAGMEDEDAILEGIAIGANDFIAKPFKPMELVLRIKRIFQDEGVFQSVLRSTARR